jgi:hypothetical protein
MGLLAVFWFAGKAQGKSMRDMIPKGFQGYEPRAVRRRALRRARFR